MKLLKAVATLMIGSVAALAVANDQTKYNEETTVSAGGTVTKKVTIKGQVIMVDPGRTIVVRQAGGEDVSYALTQGMQLPPDVQIGRTVILNTELAARGAIVTEVTVDNATPGVSKRTEKTTTTNPMTGEATTQTTTTYTVKAFQPNKSITLVGADGKAMTFSLDTQSVLPSDLTIGKQVIVQTDPTQGVPMVRRVTYGTTTTTTSGD